MEREARELSRFLLRPVLHVTAIVASPFFMLAFLFFLLGRPALWSLVPLAVGALLLLSGLLVWLLVRRRLVSMSRDIDRLLDSDILTPPR